MPNNTNVSNGGPHQQVAIVEYLGLGSSSEVNSFNNETKKKSKNRHRPRHRMKKPSESSLEACDVPDGVCVFNTLTRFKIEAVDDHSTGLAVRKRTDYCNCINLKSFTNSHSPFIFVSKICRATTFCNNLLKKFDNLSVNSTKTNKRAPSGKQRSKKQAVSDGSAKISNKNSGEKTKKKRNMLNRKPHLYPDYLGLEEVEKGIADGSLITGKIRINIKNSKSAYVNNEDRTELDYLIPSVEDRNRALEGDEVVLKEKPQSEWVDGQKTASVVYILKKEHPRTAVGFLKLMPDRNREYAIFHPRDYRVPRIRIPNTTWPKDFYKKAEQYEDVLFMVKIIDWFDTQYALGFIIENLGTSGDLKAENKAILLEYDLDVKPFDADIDRYFTIPKNIPEGEFSYREDLREECIFTIDPMTARDLDDAVSCKKLKNGNYEIGVHISDVAYYLDENTHLDKIVCDKATTIYLVDSTYHMLPLELCLHCSLLPGVDKTAFSVIWEMDSNGQILKRRFARSIINSCAKLAYEHAQAMIENPESPPEDMPEIYNGYHPEDLSCVVNTLQNIALKLRERRFANGALRLDQPKLCFELDPQNGKPSDWGVYETKDAHRLIEEFMLLANISVAEKIYEAFPKLAFLRCHDPPIRYMLEEVKNNLDVLGLHLNIESSGELQESLWSLCTPDNEGRLRMAVLNHLLAKPMTRATYFCAGSHYSSFEHYALHIPLYTHFTSPIRRYADIMVHRLLAASLGYTEKPEWEVKNVASIADNCNKKKYNAKRAGDASIDLYLAHYIEKHQPFIQDAVVADVKDKSFEVIILKTGSVIKINSSDFNNTMTWKSIENNDGASSSTTKKKKLYKAEVTFLYENRLPPVTVTIEMFSVVKVALKRKDKTNKLTGTLVRPIPTLVFEGKS